MATHSAPLYFFPFTMTLRGGAGPLGRRKSPQAPGHLRPRTREIHRQKQRCSRRVATQCLKRVPRRSSLVFSVSEPLRRGVAQVPAGMRKTAYSGRASPRGEAQSLMEAQVPPGRRELFLGSAGPHGEAQALMATHSVPDLAPSRLCHAWSHTKNNFSIDGPKMPVIPKVETHVRLSALECRSLIYMAREFYTNQPRVPQQAWSRPLDSDATRLCKPSQW